MPGKKKPLAQKRKEIAARFNQAQPDFTEWLEQAMTEIVANARPGDIMPDGTVYAGISPVTNDRLLVTPADADLCMKFHRAADYAESLDAHGHQDWHIPTEDELKVIYKNRNEGALKDTFNLSGEHPTGWYWSSTPSEFMRSGRVARRFGDGFPSNGIEANSFQVRCVRRIPS